MTLDEILDAAPLQFDRRETFVPTKAQRASERATLTPALNKALDVIDRCSSAGAAISNRTNLDRPIYDGGPCVSAGAAKRLVELGVCEVTCAIIYGATATGTGYARGIKMGRIRRAITATTAEPSAPTSAS